MTLAARAGIPRTTSGAAAADTSRGLGEQAHEVPSATADNPPARAGEAQTMAEQGNERQLVVFDLGGEAYGVNIATVR